MAYTFRKVGNFAVALGAAGLRERLDSVSSQISAESQKQVLLALLDHWEGNPIELEPTKPFPNPPKEKSTESLDPERFFVAKIHPNDQEMFLQMREHYRVNSNMNDDGIGRAMATLLTGEINHQIFILRLPKNTRERLMEEASPLIESDTIRQPAEVIRKIVVNHFKKSEKQPPAPKKSFWSW